MPSRCSAGEVWLHLRLEACEQSLVDVSRLRQVHHGANVAFGTPFQFGQRKVVRFQRPEPYLVPQGKGTNEPSLVAVWVVRHRDMIDTDPVFLVKRRPTTGCGGDSLKCLFGDDAEDVQIGRLPARPQCWLTTKPPMQCRSTGTSSFASRSVRNDFHGFAGASSRRFTQHAGIAQAEVS
jgi:hypothetical protein